MWKRRKPPISTYILEGWFHFYVFSIRHIKIWCTFITWKKDSLSQIDNEIKKTKIFHKNFIRWKFKSPGSTFYLLYYPFFHLHITKSTYCIRCNTSQLIMVMNWKLIINSNNNRILIYSSAWTRFCRSSCNQMISDSDCIPEPR